MKELVNIRLDFNALYDQSTLQNSVPGLFSPHWL